MADDRAERASFAATAGAAASQALVGILITGPGATAALWLPAGIAATAVAAAVLTGHAQTLDAAVTPKS